MRTVLLLLSCLVLSCSLLPLRAEDRKRYTDSERKAAFLKLLDRPKVPADVKATKPSEMRNGLHYETFSFATEKKADGTIERMPVLLVKPATSDETRRPVVIVMHGTGGNKESFRGWLEEFARQGIIGVSIDARYHGERSGGTKGSDAYVAAITKAWQTPAGQPREHPFYYDTCWDLWRLLDVLQARPDIDPNRIGMMGISMGGIQTWLAAAVDDRVQAAAPLIGVQSFRWSLDNDKWQGRARTILAAHEAAAKDLGERDVNQRVCRELWTKVIPGILDNFDGPQLLPLFAGRPLFIANGERDPNCPIEGAKLAMASAREAFEKAGCSEKLKILIAEGVPHKVTDEMRKESIAFMVKSLAK